MTVDLDKFKKLCEEKSSLEKRKIRLEEQFKAKKEALTKLVKEIKTAGYDPNNLKTIIQDKEKDLLKSIEDFEGKIKEASSKLASIEA